MTYSVFLNVVTDQGLVTFEGQRVNDRDLSFFYATDTTFTAQELRDLFVAQYPTLELWNLLWTADSRMSERRVHTASGGVIWFWRIYYRAVSLDTL